MMEMRIEGTTIICVRKDNEVCLAGDGQVTFGNTILKPNANKLRKLREGKIVAGFAGSTADAFTLFERFEAKVDQHQGKLKRACVALAKDWRSDKVLRRLEAFMIIADADEQFLITGAGDVVENGSGILAIGSGGNFALAAATALLAHTQMTATEIALKAMAIAADICVFTNTQISHETLKP